MRQSHDFFQNVLWFEPIIDFSVFAAFHFNSYLLSLSIYNLPFNSSDVSSTYLLHLVAFMYFHRIILCPSVVAFQTHLNSSCPSFSTATKTNIIRGHIFAETKICYCNVKCAPPCSFLDILYDCCTAYQLLSQPENCLVGPLLIHDFASSFSVLSPKWYLLKLTVQWG